jgi:FO synthase
MTPEQVLAVVEDGARLGCTEALFSLGDAPEAVFPEAREILQGLGYRRTLEYLRAVCALVLKRSSLFPHANPGVMGEPDLRALKPVNASLGLMLESASPRLLEPGGPHHGAVTKHPRVRLRVMEVAGQLRIPFTTGLLIGIGETLEERVDSLLAIRAIHERYGHIRRSSSRTFAQSRASPCNHPEPTLEEMLRTVAVARLTLGPSMNLQAPPNLTQDYGRLLDAGINDWGGVSPVTKDFINPEAPWPHLEALRAATEARGCVLRQRLPVYPEYILDRREYLPPELDERIRAAVDGDGLVPDDGANPMQPSAYGGNANERTGCYPGGSECKTDNGQLTAGQWPVVRCQFSIGRSLMETTVLPCDADTAVRNASPAIARILDRALEGRELSRAEGLTLAEGGPEAVNALVAVADEIRRRRVGDIITYVVNRNINFTNICIIGCKFCAFSTGPNAADAYDLSFDEIARRAVEAWERGATEVCVQGGLPRELEGTHYRDILRAIKQATPEMHIHAFSPMEIMYGVERTGMPLADYLGMLRAEGLGVCLGRRRDPGRRHPTAPVTEEGDGDPVGGGHHDGPSPGHPHHLDHDVWPRGAAGALGQSALPAAGHPEGDGRFHGVRAVGIRALQHRPLPAGEGPARPDAGGAPEGACAGPAHASGDHRQHPSLLGEAGTRAIAAVPAGGGQ